MYERPLPRVYILNSNLRLAIGTQMQNLCVKSGVYYPVTGLVGFETVPGPRQTSRGLSSTPRTRFHSKETRDLDRRIHGTRYFIRERKINETPRRVCANGERGGSSRSSAEARVEKLIPSRSSLCLPQRRYKSPSPARFEERYKRAEVGTTFIPRADLYLTV